jgi:hypothetical protein
MQPLFRAFFTLLVVSVATCQAQLRNPLYKRIPVASIKPSGWALQQAKTQADGLVGHLHDHDSYVKGSIWLPGGSVEYSQMQESGPYWFNGQVALAFQLGDQRLIDEVREFLDFTLDNQNEDGWLGPEPSPGDPRLTWPRYLFLLGAIQYAEADPSQFTRITDAMHRFVDLVHDTWANHQEGDPSLGFQFHYQFVRWEELVYSLQWLYDNDPRGQEKKLVETMTLVRNQGYSWKNSWFTDAAFPTKSVTKFTDQTHGVNQAEALKSEALAWRMTGDKSDRESTFKRLDLLYKFHGQASGTYSADEHLGGLNPSRGTETCTVVEQIFSLATIHQIFGNNSVADRVEKLEYNALPAALLSDWKSHQYDQEVNQIWAQVMDPPPWGNNGPSSNVFGFEPNYPCCTVNHGQAAPKFWSNSFVTDISDNSLVHVLLGPSQFDGKVGNNTVKVLVDTLYPFGSRLSYSVTTDNDLTFKIRIPSWAQGGSSTIAIEQGSSAPVQPDATTSFHSVDLKAGTTSITIKLDQRVEIEKRFNDAVAITRGALNYALELSFNQTSSPGRRSQQALGDVKRLYPNAPAAFLQPFDNATQDHTLLPTTEWRVAINPDTIQIHDSSDSLTEIDNFTWDPASLPVFMTVDACRIEWGLEKGTAAPPPQSPNTCVGKKFQAKLVPFGAAKLRLGEIPTFAA